jgi:ATP-dependent Clp protease ATP-binding subunit ClpA
MFERFTDSAREVVKGAQDKAVATTASEIRPEHLLMGVLDHPTCLAVTVMDRLGASPQKVSATLERHRLRHVDGLDEDDADALRAIGIDLDEVVRRIDENLGGLAAPSSKGRPRFSRAAKKVLELALREALSLRHGYIGTEHILLGLSRGGDRVVADTFAELGLAHAALRAAVAEAVRRAG